MAERRAGTWRRRALSRALRPRVWLRRMLAVATAAGRHGCRRPAGRAILRPQDHYRSPSATPPAAATISTAAWWRATWASTLPGQPTADRAEHAGRRQPQGRELSLRGRAQGRHGARHRRRIRRARTGARQSRRPIRRGQVHLCRPRRHQQQHLHAVAHRQGAVARRRQAHGDLARRHRPGIDRGDRAAAAERTRSAPGSSSSAAIPPRARPCSPWSAARSRAPPPPGRR